MTTPASETETPAPTVREAVQADLLAVYRIEKASFPQPWPFAAFQRFIGEPGFLIAEVGAGVAGYIVADSIPNHGRPLGHVKDLAVHPDQRGQGVGSTLLRRAMGVMRAEGVAEVKLEVREGNDAARDLYESFGFEHRRTVPRYYDDGENALVLVADL
ncbi:ribosomal-protein-alanine N-acetyltransferase [Halorientalis sp. IM1011]|uniref:ribosomal protein S18-alanine N-acetyltransferase n=1 Tax=Halorientalis sp. IM1011 TaxID=1932360 RepID=UPI00097CCDDA|nr:ribosomal protein S18-alanine N-acetyltransferase [Halorientalis sp. IM1011]AQL43161.1 ribosomal-protein-alanine N-acetyltransferase [Halorientalis sp. IM1011]